MLLGMNQCQTCLTSKASQLFQNCSMECVIIGTKLGFKSVQVSAFFLEAIYVFRIIKDNIYLNMKIRLLDLAV